MTDYNAAIDENSTVLDIDTSDAQEPTVVPEGEYKLRITGYKKKNDQFIYVSDSGARGFIVTFDIPDEPASKGLSKYFSLPSDDYEAKRNNSIKWELDCFKRAFGMANINFEVTGQTGYALLKVTNSDTYGEQNEVRKFIAGA